MRWLNEPERWAVDGATLTVQVGPDTDFWRGTHYGYFRDSGHVYGLDVSGDAVVSTRISTLFRTQYDQVGLMARVDERGWVKAGVEFADGALRFSTVVTADWSSWMTCSLPPGTIEVWLRLQRRAEAVQVGYSLDGRDYEQAALVHLRPDAGALVGAMCAAPEGGGFTATFHDLRVRAG